MTALGPQGLRETAELCARKAHYAAEALARAGLTFSFDRPFFKEFTLQVRGDVQARLAEQAQRGILGGLPLGQFAKAWADRLLVTVTEKRSKAEIDSLAAAWK